MFGYVRPAMSRLSREEQEDYHALYCGLCHTLDARCGFFSRFLLNYDFTFLAALLGSAVSCRSCRCVASPLKKKRVICTDPALELAADCSVIFTWYKLKDEVADGGFSSRQLSRTAMLALRRAYQKAAAQRPDFDRKAAEELRRLTALEKNRCANVDESADTFGKLLESVTLELEDPLHRRILGQLIYHLGRWIYLTDALDDWKDDWKHGSYNPIGTRFALTGPEIPEEVKHRMGITLDASIRQMAAAFELWNFGPWSHVIEATVYDGLYSVGHAVLEGTFHAGDKKAYFTGEKEQL
jgi:hypothetical protein